MTNRLPCLLFASLLVGVVACSGSTDTVAPPASGENATQPEPDPSASSSSSTSSSSSSSSSSSGGTTKPSSNPATATDCDTVALSYCTKITTCNLLAAKLFGSDAVCKERISGACKAHLGAPGSGITHAGILACAQAMTADSCDAAFGGEPPPACAFKGTLAAGAACAGGDQCASGKCTIESGGCGTCAASAPPPGAAVGQACSTTNRCVSSATCVSGKCVANADLNEPCDNAGVSAPMCKTSLGLWCDAGSKTCQPMGIASLGGACGFVGESVVVCGAGTTCNYGTNGSGSCVAETPIGGTCTAGSTTCAIGTSCVGGVCGYPTAAACK